MKNKLISITTQTLHKMLEKLVFQTKEKEKQVAQLKLSEDRFNLLLKASEDMITIHKPNGKYLYYNGPACYAITSKDIVGKMPNDLFDKDVSNTLLNAFKKVEETGESETVDVLLDWLGNKKWFSENIYPIKNADGKVVEMVKVCININERKIAEQELTLANTKLAFKNEDKEKQVVELARIKIELEQQIACLNDSAIVSEADADGNIIFVNDKFCKISGYERDELIGKNHRILKSGKQPEGLFIGMWAAISTGSVWKGEVMNKKKDGKEFYWVDTTIMPFKDLNGKIIKYVSVRFDITEEVEQKRALIKQTEALKVSEEGLRDRTLKLKKALKKEKELSELKLRFVTNTSHEFRTPLTAINLATSSIKKYWDRMESPIREGKLDKITEQVMYMRRLLDEALIVRQAETGQFKNNPLHLNLKEFIDEIIEDVYFYYNKSHEILLIDNEELKNDTIFIDKKLGQNIFTNLINNAVKFSPKANKVSVELSSEIDHTIISVTDFGIGISESELKKIFEPFSRGESVDLIPGIGLGLTIAKESIDAIGGEIIVKSTIGEGTSVFVKIPKI
jgi:PAS domain S-box-containing protein